MPAFDVSKSPRLNVSTSQNSRETRDSFCTTWRSSGANCIRLHDRDTALLAESLQAILKTPTVILAAIQFPTAETNEGTYVEAPESMEALNRTQSNLSRSRDHQIKLEAIPEPHPCALFPPLLTTIPGHPPATLTVLLDRIARRPGTAAAMLGTTAAHPARHMGASVTNARLDTTHPALPGFAAHLDRIAQKNGSPLTYNSVQSYLNHALILLALARNSGWKPTPIPAELAWQSELGTIQTAQLPKSRSRPDRVCHCTRQDAS